MYTPLAFRKPGRVGTMPVDGQSIQDPAKRLHLRVAFAYVQRAVPQVEVQGEDQLVSVPRGVPHQTTEAPTAS
jgi:hypothetical protein